MRQERSKPLLDDMHAWLLREREALSRSSEVLKSMNYMLRRGADFARFLDDGTICLSNNAAERALRGIALGRRNWTFAGSLRGADRAAIMLTMMTTCHLNDVDPKAWLADVPSSCIASARTAALGMEASAPSGQPRRSASRLILHPTLSYSSPRPRACVYDPAFVVCVRSIRGGVQSINFHDKLKAPYKRVARLLADELEVPILSHKKLRAAAVVKDAAEPT
ncbi:hypothetical protein ABIF86_000254 [Bradyrhizobium japonicum]